MNAIANEIMYKVIMQVIMIIQFFCIVGLFLDKQEMILKRMFYCLLTLLGLYTIVLPHIKEAGFYLTINCIVLCWVLYHGAILHKSLCIVISLGINTMAEMLNQALIHRLMQGYLTNDKWEALILQLGSMILVLTLAIVVKNKRLLKKNKYAYEALLTKEIIALSILAIFSICIVYMGILIYSGNIQVAYNRVFLCIIMAGAIILDLSLFIIINHSLSINYYKNLSKVIKAQLNKQLTYYERLEEVNQETRAIKHDMRNHMLVINDLLENKEMDELKMYVADITKSVVTNERLIQTRNPIADAILNEKYRIACEQKINIHIDLQLSKKMNIEAVDLCAILSNSIDNAIEACKKIEIQEDREIKITGGINHGYLIIQVMNKTQDEFIIKNNTIKTSKQDKKQHGYGLANIKESVAKYKGEFNLSLKEHYFMLEVIINTSYV